MTFTHKGVSIYYTDQGTGEPIVLLHGFIENSSMWSSILPVLTQYYRVICIDLLGHGGSGCTGYIHTMEDMASAVMSVTSHLKVTNITIIGHSMGGYVGCAFAKAYPETLAALCLLNSSPLPDTKERKLLRTRANKMAKTQYPQLIRMSFSNLFDTSTRDNHKDKIKDALAQALHTPVQGYIAANSGMRLREDNSSFWKKGNFKKAMILGKEDWIVDSAKHRELFESYCNYFVILDGGHMSYIGQSKEMTTALLEFLNI